MDSDEELVAKAVFADYEKHQVAQAEVTSAETGAYSFVEQVSETVALEADILETHQMASQVVVESAVRQARHRNRDNVPYLMW